MVVWWASGNFLAACAAQGAPDGWPACLLSSFPYIGGLASPKLSTSLLTVSTSAFALLRILAGQETKAMANESL